MCTHAPLYTVLPDDFADCSHLSLYAYTSLVWKNMPGSEIIINVCIY